MNKEYNDNREYNEALDGLRFSGEAKARMVQGLMEAQEKPRRRARRPLSRIAAVGIAAALVLSIGAGAAVVYNKLASESFAGVFGTAHTEIVDKIGKPIGASATDNGVTITAEAIIGDKYNYAMVYEIKRDDGTPFDLTGNEYGYLPLHFEDSSTDISYMGGSHGGSFFIDETPGDNVIQFVEMMSVDGELKPGKAKASFQNLKFNDGNEDYTLIEGKWKFKFDFDFEDTSVSLPAGQTFDLNGMNAKIDQITLSPLAVRVDYTVDSEVQWDDDAPSGREPEQNRRESQRYFESLSIVLHKTDGTTMDLTNAGGSISPKNGKTVCQKGQVFDQIMPVEEIASITVGGIEIPVAQ